MTTVHYRLARPGQDGTDVPASGYLNCVPTRRRDVDETIVLPSAFVADLVDVDPDTLDPAVEPEAAWWAEVEQLDTDLSEQVVGGAVVGDDLILSRRDGEDVNAGHVRGAKGDKGDAGPIGMSWRGPWSGEVDYAENDAVSHDGAAWFAAVDPPVGEVPSQESQHWQVFALQGSQGDAGRGVVSIVRTSGDGSPGTTDTYTITLHRQHQRHVRGNQW